MCASVCCTGGVRGEVCQVLPLDLVQLASVCPRRGGSIDGTEPPRGTPLWMGWFAVYRTWPSKGMARSLLGRANRFWRNLKRCGYVTWDGPPGRDGVLLWVGLCQIRLAEVTVC